MDPNCPFGRRLEHGESSRTRPLSTRPVRHPNIAAHDHDLNRLLQTRTMRVLRNGEIVEEPIDVDDELPIELRQVTPAPVCVPHIAPPFRRFRLPSEMNRGDNEGTPSPQVSHLDAWLAHNKLRNRDELPVYHMRGYRGVSSQNSFRKWPRSGSEPQPKGVCPLEDQRLLPRLDYTLAIYDRLGKRTFFEPMLQYDANDNGFFMLDWNQSEFEGDAAGLLNWPELFVQRNKLEAKCRKYLLMVPKARSLRMMSGRRRNCLHNDVCERLEVEINAMRRRIICQRMIAKKVREAERDGFDPTEAIRHIRRDPQYASDPEVSDCSDDE